jgi:hypothetical protein
LDLRLRVDDPTSRILASVWIVAGVVALPNRARVNRAWPFGPLEIREQYLDEQRAQQTEPASAPPDIVAV